MKLPENSGNKLTWMQSKLLRRILTETLGSGVRIMKKSLQRGRRPGHTMKTTSTLWIYAIRYSPGPALPIALFCMISRYSNQCFLVTIVAFCNSMFYISSIL
ncbi:uncharacterized protein EV420DRAFT_1529356 [Desarmillaria tabescens]|uniref:Uncharacterized protein n=1 Tax=Armillaria tabescens TaxID=1929756 RepID=A0AA39N8F8_ARMTA|nr:uncharacterized protein EV420DRAFT_1529356 [Desarmillaria tabescens]KAK0460957.1 hypothetical protein EV420DRAFT_1529356 [Desarmillaria tabescens]